MCLLQEIRPIYVLKEQLTSTDVNTREQSYLCICVVQLLIILGEFVNQEIKSLKSFCFLNTIYKISASIVEQLVDPWS